MTAVPQTQALVPSPLSFKARFSAGIWCIFHEQSENAASLLLYCDGILADEANALQKFQCEKKVLLPFCIKV